MDTSEQWFTLDNRGGPIWPHHRSRRSASCAGRHDRRLQKLAMPAGVLTALGERDAIASTEHRAGAASQAMITNS